MTTTKAESMTDLHSHILPGIDDGAKDLQISLELLRKQYADRVTQIALTPHFNFERQTLEEFLKVRNRAAQELGRAFRMSGIPQRMKLGAEVFYSSEILQTDMRALCLTGTSLLLIEFPPAYYPQEAADVLYQLTRRGIVPLIAHVERYAFVRSNPNLLCDLIEAGAYTQMNATSLMLHRKYQKLYLRMIQHGMIHVVGTDTHSPSKRPPMLADAMKLVEEKCGQQMARRMIENGAVLFDGKEPEYLEPRAMRQILGQWI
ncbi:tyrosine-protein phosphatase [uncultured Ruthenibacterium sp.]|uniref:tyrosine-protein phosphatase n=1 Tax=uncultured Ruthenibacterium sp. TaxID=1905347 RepID=UPI00349E5EDB